MTPGPDQPRDPLLTISPWLRALVTLFLILLAVAHVVWPDLAIDAVFLGLLAFAALIWFFDFDAIEWQGIRARRRQIAKARAALKAAPPTSTIPVPPVPAVPSLARPAEPPSPEALATVHARPTDLMPPGDELDRLLWSAEQLRIELMVLLGSAGHLVRVAPWSDYSLVELQRLALEKRIIGTEVADAILTVGRMRNAAVHDRLLNPAAALAVDALRSLRHLPRQYVRIRKQHISLFKDRSLSTPHETAGVMLATIADGRQVTGVHVFPRETEYAAGRFTTWNWNERRVFRDEAWYEDPQDHKPRMAFGESATFKGREYPEQWGLELRLDRPDLGLKI